MKDTERRAAAKAFSQYWKDRGYEKGESQPFWLSLIRDVLGVESPEKFITFEEQVRLDHTSFIDGFIPSTHVLMQCMPTPSATASGISCTSILHTGVCIVRNMRTFASLVHNTL